MSFGILSPFKEEVSTLISPLLQIPSIKILSPVLSKILSPKQTFCTSLETNSLPLKTKTSFCKKSLSPSMVSKARFLLNISRYFPINTKQIIIATESKYTSPTLKNIAHKE